MKVEVSKSYGFCFGVERTVGEIEKLLRSGERVFTDGDVVHNKGVMKRLIDMGMKLVDPEKVDGKVDGTFAVRAHGLKPERIEKIKKKFEKVVDLTCPIVKELHVKAIECSKRGKVVVFGKSGHPEMEALKGQVEDAIVTRKAFEVDSDSVCILAQTTSPWKEFSDFVGEMLRLNFHVKRFEVLNTVCAVTVEREKETLRLSKICDLVVVVGGRHSANTEKLFRIASERTKAIWVESPDEIVAEELEGVGCVGIVSGTSTPAEDVEAVVEKILSGGKRHG